MQTAVGLTLSPERCRTHDSVVPSDAPLCDAAALRPPENKGKDTTSGEAAAEQPAGS